MNPEPAPRPPLRRRAVTRATVPTIITFRLAEEDRRALSERAATLKISPHELARVFVLETLKRASEPATPPSGHPDLLNGIQAIYYQLLETRKDIALSVEVLLTRAGRLKDPEAHEWVSENYPASCSPSPPP
jgi:hypothetical protein